MPLSCISKQPTSSAAPNRFFTPRTIRSDECLSPSNCSTTSTRCSSTRGPATLPSLVTWPTSTVAMPRSLATATSAAVTARTCVTPPATPSMPGAEMVCTESMTSRPGLDRVEVAEHRLQVGLGGQVEPLVQGAEALGAQPHLAGRLLAGDDQAGRVAGWPPTAARRRAAASTCRRRARRRAAPPRRARCRRRAPGRARRRRSAWRRAGSMLMVAIGRAGSAGVRGRQRPQRRRAASAAGGVDDRAPLAALRAAPEPLRRPVTADVALVRGTRPPPPFRDWRARSRPGQSGRS